MDKKCVCLGRIAGPHGVRGLVKILPFGDDPSLIENLGPAYQGKRGDIDFDAPRLQITLKNRSGKYILASVDICTDRNIAETLKGVELYYDRALLPETADDEFYYDDLRGLQVIEGDKVIGTIQGVDNFGAGDLLDVKPANGPSFYLPYHDDYVTRVDVEGKVLHAQNIQDILIS